MKKIILWLAAALLLPLAVSGALAGDPTPEETRKLDLARDISDAFAIIADQVRPAVVNIQAELGEGRIVQGSGVIMDERGYIITNDHVVHGAAAVVVRLTDGREIIAEIVGQSPESDIAVIRITAPNLTVARVGNSDTCRVGNLALVIGNPMGLESSVAAGIISAKGRSNVVRLEIADFIQTDAAVNPGNSGGALVNMRGEVIGISSVTSRNSEGLSFAIPINLAVTVMKGIIDNRQATSSYLGVIFHSVDRQTAEAFGLPFIRGVLVKKVIADTPAARASLQAGDIILRYGDREVLDEHQLRTLVATTAPGEVVEIEYFRRGHNYKAEVKVETMPAEVVVARRGGKLLEDLGVQLKELTPKAKKELGYESTAQGVLVVGVAAGSVAKEFLAPGSLIVKVNNTPVTGLEQLRAELVKAADGGEVLLGWRFGRYYGTRRLVRE